jgi:deoxyguanosine kinase
MDHPWYIVIEGAIGVGKTTLARMLSDRLHTRLLLEVFEENPFLAKFYESRARYAFQTQMFFLLSRYRQQQQVPEIAHRTALISDYMFDKDRLFARLNLAGDEWEIYQQLQTALARQIALPDLIVYLQADTDVLMARIAQRDRPYERDMDRDYIEAVGQAYRIFFQEQRETPVLSIDTNDLNFVANPADLQLIVDRLQSALKEGMFQHPLPDWELDLAREEPLTHSRPLADLQRFHVELDRLKGFDTNVYFNFLCLSEEIGELGSALADLWREEVRQESCGQSGQDAHEMAMRRCRQDIESELADCMAYLLKLSNYAQVDLESAYVAKMKLNRHRVW